MKKNLFLISILLITRLAFGQTGNLLNFQKISNNLGGLGNVLDYNDVMGYEATLIGDVNHDGINDIAVSAFRDDDGGTDKGAVYILFLDTNKTVKSYQKISALAGNLSSFVSLNNSDLFGSGLSSAKGDFNGDSIPDIVVGTQYDDNGGTNTGAIYLIYLNINGTVKGATKISATTGYGTSGIPISIGSNFGCTVDCIGDINNDGINDLAVGAFLDVQGGMSKGAVYILKMKANGTVKSYFKLIDGIANFNAQISNQDYFGVSVGAISDRNSDGIPDLAVGSYYYGNNNEGAFYLIYLDSNGVKGFNKIANGFGGMPNSSVFGNFGISVREANDINGNGVKDILVGADFGTNSIYLLYMNSANNVDSFKIFTQSNFGISNSRLGSAVDYIGDLNNDGNPEFIVGAPFYNSQSGLIIVFSLKSTYQVTTQKTNATCAYSNNGSAKVIAASGVPPYTYLWSNNSTADSIGGLAPGNYTVTITDSLNRQVIKNILIASNPAVNLVHSNNYSLCAGLNTTLIASASGGSGSGFSYHWNNGLSNASSHIVSPTVNTTYTIFATDSLGCSSDTSSISITINPLPTVSASGLNVAYCSNDNASVPLTGIPSGGSFSGTGVTGNNFIPANSALGNVNLIYIYTNTQGCVGKDTISTIVYAAPTIQFSGIASAYCINSANIPLSASPTGGNFTVNNIAATDFSPSSLGVGNHQIKYFVTNAAGCSAVDSINSYVNPITNASFYGLNSTYCDNDVVSTLVGAPTGGTFLSATGLSGTSFNPTIALAGNHSISYVYTNIYGCKDTATHSTTIFASTPVTISTSKTMFCNNEGSVSISLSHSGGTLSGPGVNNSNQTFSPSLAGLGQKTINYSYTNSNGCTTSTSHSVTVNSPVSASFTGLNSSYCDNDLPSVLVGSPAGGSFVGPNIFGSIFNPVNSTAGMKTIHYIYNNGCIDTATQYTVIYASPAVNITTTNNYYCSSSSPVALTASPSGGVFSGTGVSGNSFSPSVAGLGNHTIIYNYTNAQSCSNADTFMIQVGSSVSIDFSAVSTSYCLNNTQNTLPVIPSGGIWSGNGIAGNTFNGSLAGLGNHWLKYSYSVSSGCGDTDSLQVTVFPLPYCIITGNLMNYCLNSLPDTFLGTPSGGQFIGSGMIGNIFDAPMAGAGIKLVQYIYTDSNNCSSTATISLIVNSLPTANAGNDLLIPCSSSGLQIGSSPQVGLSYLWSPSAGLSSPTIANPIAKPLGSTSYVLTASNITTTCSNTDTIFVSVPPGPQITVSADQQICLNDTAVLSASGAPQFIWSNGATGNSISVSPSISKFYSVLGTDIMGCVSADSVFITVHPLPNPSLGGSINLVGLDSFELFPGYFSSYLWNTGDTTPSIMVYIADIFKTFTVVVMDSNGCQNIDSVFIDYEGINDLFPGVNAKFFPNPAIDFLTIEFSQLIDLDFWNVIDINGKLIKKQRLTSKIQNLKIDLSDLKPGYYILRLESNRKQVNIKIIKN